MKFVRTANESPGDKLSDAASTNPFEVSFEKIFPPNQNQGKQSFGRNFLTEHRMKFVFAANDEMKGLVDAVTVNTLIAETRSPLDSTILLDS